MRKLSIKVVLTLVCIFDISGCGRPTYVVLDADQKYFDALAADAGGDCAAAIALLDEAIAAQPGHYMYLKRAELHLKQGDDQAAKDDIRQADAGGAPPEDCDWLSSQAKRDLDQRFQGPFATAPSQNK